VDSTDIDHTILQLKRSILNPGSSHLDDFVERLTGNNFRC